MVGSVSNLSSAHLQHHVAHKQNVLVDGPGVLDLDRVEMRRRPQEVGIGDLRAGVGGGFGRGGGGGERGLDWLVEERGK